MSTVHGLCVSVVVGADVTPVLNSGRVCVECTSSREISSVVCSSEPPRLSSPFFTSMEAYQRRAVV